MRVRESRSNSYFSQESLGTDRYTDILAEDLDSDLSPVLALLSKMDDGHSTVAEHALDGIPIAQDGLQRVVHRRTNIANRETPAGIKQKSGLPSRGARRLTTEVLADRDEPLETGQLGCIDVLADLATELIHRCVRAVLLEFPQHT